MREQHGKEPCQQPAILHVPAWIVVRMDALRFELRVEAEEDLKFRLAGPAAENRELWLDEEIEDRSRGEVCQSAGWRRSS